MEGEKRKREISIEERRREARESRMRGEDGREEEEIDGHRAE